MDEETYALAQQVLLAREETTQKYNEYMSAKDDWHKASEYYGNQLLKFRAHIKRVTGVAV